jgi:CRP-like cAMP-binding protein
LSRAAVEELMADSPPLALGITKLIGLRRRRIERRLKSLLYRSNRDRLADLLVELAEQYGRRTPEGILIELKLSHQELASVIGSTRETVTLLLGQLQLEGLILVGRRRIVVRDLSRLAQLTKLSVHEEESHNTAEGHSPTARPSHRQVKPLQQEM